MEVANYVAKYAGAAVVAGFTNVAVEKLANKVFYILGSIVVSEDKVRSEIQSWETMLSEISVVLEDAEYKDEKIWLRKVRDVVYDAEDILDEVITEDLQIKHSSRKRKFSISLPFTAGRFDKIKEITCKLEAICTEKTKLDLKDKGVGGRRGKSENTTRIPTTSLSDSLFVGRDKDKEAILNLSLADGAAAAGVSVISIQGMGGLGKTALAQQLYNDEKVKIHFQSRAWVCVSDTFDILTITKTILQDVGGVSHGDKNLNQLQVALQKELSEKKFFIVLDDVWNKESDDWEAFYKPFSGGAPGSKIIVTTRNREVADAIGAELYPLGVLSSDDCLSLFARRALGATNFDGHPDLKDIGQKIVEKCKGLPLAAKTLGGLLRTKVQLGEWEDILQSQIWNLPQEKSDILPVLRLSYHHLPSQLKECFAYCAIFPKDYKFNKDELVLLWMAESFLSHPERKKRLEDLGTQYFDDLLSRAFFQPFNEGSAEFVMHDLIHDLAQDVGEEMCFHLNGEVERRKQLPTLNTRHSSFIQRFYEVPGRFGAFDEAKRLRTLLTLPGDSFSIHHISVNVLNDLLSKLGKLRALSLRGYQIRAVPVSVEGLKHIRYLNLSQTAIRMLPEFVCSLLNLETLLLTNCIDLKKLPEGIGNMPSLCHLDLCGTRQLKGMPPGIGNLTKIQTLGKFIVGRGEDGLKLRELKNLSELKGELCLEGLHHMEKSEDTREADLKSKQGLRRLVVRWSDDLHDHMVNGGGVQTEVLELLEPHGNVERLAVEFFCGTTFPSWLGDPLLMSKVTEIELCNCWFSTSLPPLGRLPVLKHLIIKGMSAVKTLGFAFFGCDEGGFLALETLKFEDMEAWEKWCSVGSSRESGWQFPCLQKLEILNCPVLVGECMVSLPSLRTLKLEKCNESFLRCMVDMGSLTSLSIGEMSRLSCLHDSIGQLLLALEELEIYECGRLVSLWRSEAEIEDHMTNLRSLEVRSCPELVSLMKTATISKMSSLEKMIVRECPRIGSIEVDQQQERNGEVKLPPKLRRLELDYSGKQFMELDDVVVVMSDECVLMDRLMIQGCDRIIKLTIKSRRGGNKVKRMRILKCIKLVSVSRTGIVEIEELEIWNCPSLQSLVAVKKLELTGCRQLLSLAEESVDGIQQMSMPWTTIENVTLTLCPNLKSLAGLHQLTNLTGLTLDRCNGLELFPERGFPFPNLSSLRISECENLKGMPNNMQCLTSLYVVDCEGLESFPGEGSLPPNLTELTVMFCRNVKQKMSEWRLDSLSSLEELCIEGVGDGDFKGMLLPTTLRVLTIGAYPKLKYISSSSTSASSKCFHLPKNLTSLANLYIWECPKLRCLPKEGLPPTLQSLEICDCPVVANTCLEGKGEYWSRISLISQISLREEFGPNVEELESDGEDSGSDGEELGYDSEE